MKGTCKFSGEFSVRMESPADDPFWAHVPTCPDCQALVNAYREFLNSGDHVELEFDPDEADKELAARLDATLDLPFPQAASAQSSPGFFHWWNRKEFWYSTAAILVVGAGFFMGQDLMISSNPGFDGDSAFVRGDDSTAGVCFCTWESGSLQVTWPEQAGADLIRIILFDGAMTELKNFTAPVVGPFLISDSSLTKQAAFGQVYYLAQGDVLQRSPLFPIPPIQ